MIKQARLLHKIFLLVILGFTNSAIAQTAVTENFDALSTMPLGWTQASISGVGNGNEFTVVTTGTNPACTPISAPRMLKYDAYAAASGDDAYLASVPYDFTNRGGNNPTVNFRIWRETTAGTDRVEVYVNTVPDITGALFLGSVHRNRNTAGVGSGTLASNQWDNITFTITDPSYNTSSNYIIFKGITGSAVNAGGNVFIDNIIVNTYPKNMLYVSSSASQIVFPMGQGATDQQILRLEIEMDGAQNPCAVTTLRLNTNGTTNTAEITNAKIYYTAGSEEFQAVNQFGTTLLSPIGTNITFTGTRTLVNGKNYFWLTYSVSGSATIGNFFDADWIDYDMNGNCTANPYTPLVQAPTGSRFIDYNYCTTSYSTGTTTSRYIEDVILPGEAGTGVLSNTNSCRATSSPWYTFYPPVTGFTTTLKQGNSYTLTTRLGARTPFGASSSNSNNGHVQNVIAWIDFNRNGSFESWERIYEGFYANGNKYIENGWSPTTVSPPSGTCAPKTTINPNGDVSGTFIVPSVGATIAGPTRMRVRFVRYSRSTTTSPAPANPSLAANPLSPPNTTGATSGAFTSQHSPCGTYTGWVAYGETEDYVVTITPPCSSGEWLGFTEDWDNPANWCDGVPISTTNVIIPTVPVGGKMPTIFDGTLATCNDIIIHTGATVTIKSPKNGNWQIYGTLTNNGTIDVPTVFNNNFVIGSGTLNSQALAGAYITPFSGGPSGGTWDSRSQMRYTVSELLAKGFTAGDAISTIGFQVTSKQESNPFGNPPYRNFNLTIGHVSAANNWVYALSSTGQAWFPFSGTTSSYSNVAYTPTANSDNLYNLSAPFIWNGIDDILVELCFNNNTGTSTDKTDQWHVTYTQTTGVPSFKHVNSTSASYSDGCSLPDNIPATSGVSGNIIDRRANLVVESYSPNGIYPLYIRGDWINNGTFNAGRSNVIFDGTALQLISGTNLTTFSRLSVAKTGVVRLDRTADVDSSLYLNSGILELGGYTLTLNNPTIHNPSVGTLSNFHSLTSVPAWARNAGFVRAETMTSANLGYIQWNIGSVSTVPSTYQFPFGSGAIGSNTGTYIPIDVDYTLANTDLGNVKASTYATPPNNLEMPPTVTHINGLVASPNDPNMVDRYWIIEKTGAATSGAGFKVNWIASENAANPVAPYAVQRWYNGNWPFNGIGTHTGTQVAVTNTQLNAYTPAGWQPVNIWAAAGFSTPLPIELLSFDAQLRGREVHLKWTTATEKNNDYFTIEKTRDAGEFLFVKQVPGAGTSTTIRNYSAIDPDPLKGLSYYRLGQTDYDGTTIYSELVPVNYNYSNFEIISSTSTESIIIVAFNYDSSDPVNFVVTDAMGRTMIRKENSPAKEGANILDVDAAGWVQGVYFITLYNSEKSISRKLFYNKQ